MGYRKFTATKFNRINKYSEIELVTVLTLGTQWAICLIENFTRDSDTIGPIQRSSVPPPIIARMIRKRTNITETT